MPNDKVTIHVKLTSKPNKIDELLLEHQDLMRHFRAEDGVEYSEFLQNIESKREFTVIIKYSSSEHYEIHRESVHLTKFLTEKRPILIDDLTVTMFKTRISCTGDLRQ